jgi:predicted NUDIX family NTP pyrophosphohydrolase
MFDKNAILVSGALVFKDENKKPFWLLVKQTEEDGWEIPKTVVRKTESSVRGALRIMGEQGGMNVRILEEVGRAGGTTAVNGKVVPQRYIYYVLRYKTSQGELIGFQDTGWFEYSKAQRKLASKREKGMVRDANVFAKKWLTRKKKKKPKL